jgi:hypothetical protein
MPGPPSVSKADAIAISGWDEDHPAPRLNLQPNPFATIHPASRTRRRSLSEAADAIEAACGSGGSTPTLSPPFTPPPHDGEPGRFHVPSSPRSPSSDSTSASTAN